MLSGGARMRPEQVQQNRRAMGEVLRQKRGAICRRRRSVRRPMWSGRDKTAPAAARNNLRQRRRLRAQVAVMDTQPNTERSCPSIIANLCPLSQLQSAPPGTRPHCNATPGNYYRGYFHLIDKINFSKDALNSSAGAAGRTLAWNHLGKEDILSSGEGWKPSFPARFPCGTAHWKRSWPPDAPFSQGIEQAGNNAPPASRRQTKPTAAPGTRVIADQRTAASGDSHRQDYSQLTLDRNRYISICKTNIFILTQK